MAESISVMRFESAEEFLIELTPWSENRGFEGYIFRGHASAEYELLPTSLRGGAVDHMWRYSNAYMEFDGRISDDAFSLAYVEYQLIRDFYRMADSRGLYVPSSDRLRKLLHQSVDSHTMSAWLEGDAWLPNDMLETAGLAQHYGIPTRLLDWSYNPFVAAFFASKSCSNSDGDLCIWGLNAREAGFLEHADSKFPLKMVNPHYNGNPNLSAQNGLFTHWAIKLPSLAAISLEGFKAPTVDRRPLDVLVEEYVTTLTGERHKQLFVKLVLPRSETVALARALRKFGYGPSRLFPGYAGAAEEIQERGLLK
jgi:hypothetical protein